MTVLVFDHTETPSTHLFLFSYPARWSLRGFRPVLANGHIDRPSSILTTQESAEQNRLDAQMVEGGRSGEVRKPKRPWGGRARYGHSSYSTFHSHAETMTER